MQCSAVQCSAVQCSAVQCSAVQCSTVEREEVEDDRPSALPLRKVTVDVFSKGERIVSERDISPYPPANESSNRKPKDWKNAMKMAELAAKDL